MYNYPNFQNYNYPTNNMTNNKDNNLFDAYNGFIRGNMFKSLYDPYINNEPYEVKPMNDQAKLLTKIDATCFSMIDLNLYLDIYPNDSNMINLFNQYRMENEKLVNEYESKYGPLNLNSDSLNTTPWAWDNMPWPWDN